MKFLNIFLMWLLPVFTACTTGIDKPPSAVTNTPALNQSRVVQNTETPIPTTTRIPLPSPTPTPTPWLLTESNVTPIPTSTTVPVVPQAEVLVSSLHVRQGPGVAYPAIGVVRMDDKLTVTGLNNNWLQVTISSGLDGATTGWISGDTTYTRLTVSVDNIPAVEAPPYPAAPEVAMINQPSNNQGKLIFMTGSGGDLYAINLSGGHLQHLTDGVIDPVVSPNGQQVAFTRWDGAELGAVYIINVDGEDERLIKNDLRQPKSPTWSPDGKQLIISYQYGGLRNPTEICKRYKFGESIRFPGRATITHTKIEKGSFFICYIPFEDLQWHLAKIEVDAGLFEDLPSDEYTYNPAWDPNNPWRVIYDGNYGLVQLDLTNGNRWALTEDLRDSGPVFSPDGQMLALTYKQHDHWETYTLDVESGARQRLTKPSILADPQYSSASPAWSPDGKQLAFITDRTGQWEIWVMKADGSNQHSLLSPEITDTLNLQYHGVNERMLNWIW